MSNPYEDLINNPRAETAPADPAVPSGAASSNPYDDLVTTPSSTTPQPKPKPQAELRTAEYSPSQWLGNKAQDALIALGAKPYVAGRVGRGALNAASLIPFVGGPIAALDAGYYAQRGDPLMFGVNAVGALPLGVAGRRAISGMPTRALAPEERQLGEAADDAYNAWRSSGVRYSPGMMDDATNEIARVLLQRGENPASAPKQFAALDAGRGLKTQTGMTNQHFETLRQQLGGGETPGQRAAGEAAKEALERYMTNPPAQHIRSGTPQEIASDRELLLMGRGNVAAKKRSEVISDAANIAELKSETGKDFGRVLSGKIDALETTKAGQKSIRSFTDEEAELARNAITNRLTRGMEAGGGALAKLGSSSTLIPGAGIGASLWHKFGLDPYTAGAAGLAAQGGLYGMGRAVQNRAGTRMGDAVEEAAANLRLRSPLAQAPGSPYGRITDPRAQRNDAAQYLAYPWLRQEGEEQVEAMRTPFEYR